VSGRKPTSFGRDESGAVLIEATAAILTFFLLVFGVVEFSYIFYQWNAASKAVQWGARLAAVSDPVASNLRSLTGLESGTLLPGEAMPSYDCTCSGSTGTCAGVMPEGASACSYDAAAMTTIFLGRGNDGTNCVGGANAGMCTFFPGLEQSNIEVSYQSTGMGYAGREVGPVPTITVRLQGVTYDFLFLKGLVGLTSLTFPNTSTATVTGEDLNAAGSAS